MNCRRGGRRGWLARLAGSDRRRRRGARRPVGAEALESRTLLAVSATLADAELLISMTATSDAAILRVQDDNYVVTTPFGAVGSFPATSINAIRVVGDASRPNQSLLIRPGGIVGDPLTVDAGVEATVIAAPIDAIGGVSVGSSLITIAANVTTSGPQTYSGVVRIAADVTLDAGTADVVLASAFGSTTGLTETILPDTVAFYRVVVDPAGRTLYATDPNTNFFYRVDLTTGGLQAFDVGLPATGILLSPDGGTVYLANSFNNRITVASAATGVVRAGIAVGGRPEGLALSADGQTLYVANFTTGSVNVIDTATNRISRSIAVAAGMSAVAVTADGSSLWAASESTDTLYQIDPVAGSVLGSTTVGRGPTGLAVAADGSRVFVVNNYDDSMWVVDAAGRSVTATVPVGAGPNGIAVTPDGRYAYVVNEQNDTVSVIDVAAVRTVSTVPVGSLPVGIGVTADGRTAFVGNLNSISRLDNDGFGLTVRTAGTARFNGPEMFTDLLRSFVVDAGGRVGPPLTIIESAGQVTLAHDRTGVLRANGVLISTAAGLPYTVAGLANAGWTPVAADVDGGRNTLVLRYSTGHLTFLRFDANWRQIPGSGGWIAPGTNAFFAQELAFDADLDGDGLVTIETAGDVTLAYDARSGALRAGDTPIIYRDAPLNYRTLPLSGWRAMAAEVDQGLNTVVLKDTAGGNLRFWRMDADWRQNSGDGWVIPGSVGFFQTEVAFGVDLDGDGGVTIETAGDVLFAYDGEGNLRADGTVVLDNGNPINYHQMVVAGWRPMAADVAADGRNTVVLNHESGRIRYWRFDAAWIRQTADGWIPVNSRDFFAAEAFYGADLNGNGGRTIEAAGSTVLTIDRVGLLRAHAVSGGTVDVAGTLIVSDGQPANYYAMAKSGWTARAAELYQAKNTVLLEYSTGYLRFWRLDATWNRMSGDGWVATTSLAALGIETAFGIDVNGDRRIGA